MSGWTKVNVPAWAGPDPIDATLTKVGGEFRAYYRVGAGGGIQWSVSDDLVTWENKGPCPGDVNIPWIFGAYNAARLYEDKDYARWLYDNPPEGEGPSACTECGTCLEQCPNRIPIIDQLNEVKAFFEGS